MSADVLSEEFFQRRARIVGDSRRVKLKEERVLIWRLVLRIDVTEREDRAIRVWSRRGHTEINVPGLRTLTNPDVSKRPGNTP